MIVVTVGTQIPFDRLVAMVDDIAPSLEREVFAQIGNGKYTPKNCKWSANVDASAFDAMLRDASVIVSHAGIGTVLKAYKYAKPAILMPRLAALGEHRNDHQLATVSQLTGRQGIFVATTRDELLDLLTRELTPAVATEAIFHERARLQSYVGLTVRETLGQNGA